MNGHSWGSTKFWGALFFAVFGLWAADRPNNILERGLDVYLMAIYFIMVGGNVGIRIAERIFLKKNESPKQV